MIRTILLIIAFVAGLVILDRAIGAMLRAAYDRTFTGEAGGQINEALQNRNREVIVFGSSLARHQVDPSVLEAQLGTSAFNAGCNGQDIYYGRMLQSLLIGQGCESKHFVYVINWRDLVEDEIDRARMFSVFVDESAAIRQILAASLGQRVKLQSHAYRFNTLAISTMRQLMAPEYEGNDGFVPIAADYTPSNRDFTDMDRDLRRGLTASELGVMSSKLSLYRDFAAEARRRNIVVTFVVSPTYREGRERGPGEKLVLRQLSIVAAETKANFIMLDEFAIPAFQDVRYFGDPRHLNARGAALFSRLLASCLETERPDVAKTQHVDDLLGL
ncbi:MAG TPA: hypothetical protein P5307_18985 [Pirellulaceae bacterium]|nr:hypothetical protein [Planctomycetales bacterium]MCB9938260.1 hypothetical protein [Planctomycetaceae bacterium]HRX81166.1 hypothetical protein [Pirellulaceae bacterium]